MDIIFDKEKLIGFFKKIDQELKVTAKLYIIGGSAACLAYNAKPGTKDIDTWKTEKAIEKAYTSVIKKYPQYKIPLSPAHVNMAEIINIWRFSFVI